MFSFLMTESARARRDARNWLEVADKVWHYRRDELTEPQLRELQAKTQDLRQRLKKKDDASRLKLGIEGLEAVLRRHGGRVYPKTSLTENVEFFLAAAIIILGIRAYIVQPFKIPTNSMWPSYNGMTHEVFADPADVPGVIARTARFLAFGAMHQELRAASPGAVQVPFILNGDRPFVPFRNVSGRKWLVFPAEFKEYELLVGGEPAKIRVPADFDFDKVVQDAFFEGTSDLNAAFDRLAAAGKMAETRFSVSRPGGLVSSHRGVLALVGNVRRAGDPVLSFDILTGDQLFVDRVSYQFVKPSIGDGFVFRTGNIPGLNEQDKYYVKRLVGLPGDQLEIKQPALFRNGAPITGARAFQRNAEREGNYPGYRNAGMLQPGETVVVPEERFLALGDNSPNSYDGRNWGFVPAADVVGRPLWIYYPLSRRWGWAR